jgi:hypothetical protein
MSITTCVKTLLSGVIASLSLLTLAASPSFANTHTQTRTPPTASSSTSTQEAKPTQQQTSQTTAQTNSTVEQPKQMGCSCCKNMMNNNMTDMMNNMPGMMGNPSQSR